MENGDNNLASLGGRFLVCRNVYLDDYMTHFIVKLKVSQPRLFPLHEYSNG